MAMAIRTMPALRPLQATACTVPLHHPLANERVQCAAGQVVLKLKTAWHDGTTHLFRGH